MLFKILKEGHRQQVAAPLLWIFSPKTSKASLFTWAKQLPRRPSHNFSHPLLSHPLAFWPKLESPSLFFPNHLLAKPRDSALQWRFACFLHYFYFLVALKVWESNNINHSFMCFFSKTSIVHGNKLLSQLVYVKPASMDDWSICKQQLIIEKMKK